MPHCPKCNRILGYQEEKGSLVYICICGYGFDPKKSKYREEISQVCEHIFSEWMIGTQAIHKYTYAFRVCKLCGKTERVRLECVHENPIKCQDNINVETGIREQNFFFCSICERKID